MLKQNQSLYDEYTVLDTVIMGNLRLYECGKEKDAIYDKPDFSDEDGIRAAELEEEFAELGGWEAESEASRILQGLGVDVSLHTLPMKEIRTSALSRRSRNCRRSLPAFPPTAANRGRRPRAASCWTRSPSKSCPLPTAVTPG